MLNMRHFLDEAMEGLLRRVQATVENVDAFSGEQVWVPGSWVELMMAAGEVDKH
jgi:hypothetical protein